MASAPATPALTLGLVTGLNLCPPFLAASVRAVQAGSLVGCMAFFALFFVGTAGWFVPVLATTWLARIQGATLVARIGAGLIATYYLWLAIPTLAGQWFHG